MYFVAAALETISILQALYICIGNCKNLYTIDLALNDLYWKWIHFHNPSTEAYGRLEYIRITDNAGNEYKAQANWRLPNFEIWQIQFEIQFSGRYRKTNSIFCPLTGVCWQGRGLACGAGIMDRIMVPTGPPPNASPLDVHVAGDVGEVNRVCHLSELQVPCWWSESLHRLWSPLGWSKGQLPWSLMNFLLL